MGPLLIVEDNAAMRTVLQELFVRADYPVIAAGDGAEAIQLLERGVRPCAILVDLLMPGVVGHELLDYLRHDSRFELIPIGIITGCPHLAPVGYPVFLKPFDWPVLFAFVRRARASHTEARVSRGV